MIDITVTRMLHVLKGFLSFPPTRVCTMTQTATAQNWTIRAARNPASPQATGESQTLGNSPSSVSSPQTNNEHTQAGGRNSPPVMSGRNTKQPLGLAFKISLNTSCRVATVMGMVALAAHNHPNKKLFNTSAMGHRLRLPLIYQVHLNCHVISHHVFWHHKRSGLLFLIFPLMSLRRRLMTLLLALKEMYLFPHVWFSISVQSVMHWLIYVKEIYCCQRCLLFCSFCIFIYCHKFFFLNVFLHFNINVNTWHCKMATL